MKSTPGSLPLKMPVIVIYSYRKLSSNVFSASRFKTELGWEFRIEHKSAQVVSNGARAQLEAGLHDRSKAGWTWTPGNSN